MDDCLDSLEVNRWCGRCFATAARPRVRVKDGPVATRDDGREQLEEALALVAWRIRRIAADQLLKEVELLLGDVDLRTGPLRPLAVLQDLELPRVRAQV